MATLNYDKLNELLKNSKYVGIGYSDSYYEITTYNFESSNFRHRTEINLEL